MEVDVDVDEVSVLVSLWSTLVEEEETEEPLVFKWW